MVYPDIYSFLNLKFNHWNIFTEPCYTDPSQESSKILLTNTSSSGFFQKLSFCNLRMWTPRAKEFSLPSFALHRNPQFIAMSIWNVDWTLISWEWERGRAQTRLKKKKSEKTQRCICGCSENNEAFSFIEDI